MIFWQIIPVLKSQKKYGKKFKKNDFWCLCPGQKLCENGPEIVEKKNTLLHIVSRTSRPEIKKKVRSVRGYFMRGLTVYNK
jgi:hypothetical protein